MKLGRLSITINTKDDSDFTSEMLDLIMDRFVDIIEDMKCQCFAYGKIIDSETGEETDETRRNQMKRRLKKRDGR